MNCKKFFLGLAVHSVCSLVNVLIWLCLVFCSTLSSLCIAFFRCIVCVSFLVLSPIHLISTAVCSPTTAGAHFGGIRCSRRLISSIFHLAHLALVTALFLFLFLVLTCPHLATSSQCHIQPPNHSPIIPHTSICPLLNTHYSFLFPSLRSPRHQLTLPNRSLARKHFLITLLLLLSGNVEPNPGPDFIDPTLQFACLNIRSASSVTSILDKPYLLQEFITDNLIDTLALTETWFQLDTPSNVVNGILPSGYSLINCPRAVGRGGGLALIYRSHLRVSRVKLPSYSSFECLGVKLSLPTASCTLFVIYRPPLSKLSDFTDQFSSFLTDNISSPTDILISGDFNIHVDDPTDNYALSFLSLLDSFGLQQHILEPTHESKHTLDLLISRQQSNLVGRHNITDPILSDHYALHASISILPRLGLLHHPGLFVHFLP